MRSESIGGTSLFLALQTAAPEATRPLLLIFTDGAETASLLLADEVLESVRHANVVRLRFAETLQSGHSRYARPLPSGLYACRRRSLGKAHPGGISAAPFYR